MDSKNTIKGGEAGSVDQRAVFVAASLLGRPLLSVQRRALDLHAKRAFENSIFLIRTRSCKPSRPG